MQILSQTHSDNPASIGQLFAYPFRIFFLSLSVLAVLLVPIWLLFLAGSLPMPTVMPGVLWHQHEMLFGFLSAAIAGFLLTAVCVWTNTERTHGARLVALWLVWLVARILLAVDVGAPVWLVQGINLAFLPLVMLDAGWRVWQARQPRQVMILVVLGLLWAMQLGFVLSFNPVYVQGGLIMGLALISIVGGRITPAFTSGWLRQNGGDPLAVKTIPWLDRLVLGNMIAVLAAMLLQWGLASAVLALSAGILMLVRLGGWKGWLARREPLLWILHLSILWVPLSLLLLAGHLALEWPASAWEHAAGLGAIGSLILGVVARVALGHTGRSLVMPKGMVLAFWAIQLAAVARVVTAFGGLGWAAGLGLSALLWMLAFGLLLVRYTTILASPRVDGRPG